MKYLVKYLDGTKIVSDSQTSDFTEAIAREAELSKEWGCDNVWIADAVEEIMVG